MFNFLINKAGGLKQVSFLTHKKCLYIIETEQEPEEGHFHEPVKSLQQANLEKKKFECKALLVFQLLKLKATLTSDF